MSKIEALTADTLAETPSTPGITRHVAFKGGNYMVIRSRTGPGAVSGWHHHGDHDVYGYVVAGAVRLEAVDDIENAITVSPGDFFHVPQNTVHREINPSASEPGEVILFLLGGGPLVFNVEDTGQN
jgi:quercetin dioxygenase-like cupin family protein